MAARRRAPAPEEQLEHLRDRFGLDARPGARPLAHREHADPALAEALEVPHYAWLYNANVVPREAHAQHGRLEGALAVDVGVPRRAGVTGAAAAIERSQLLARVLMAQFEAPGAVYSIQALAWEEEAASGTLVVEVASGRGSGDSLARVEDGDLGPVLEAVLDAVRPPGTAFAISRDPVDLRDEPASHWRWVHPVVPEDRIEEFATLARDTAFEVLTLLVGSAAGSCRPLKTVPDWYVDVPGL